MPDKATSFSVEVDVSREGKALQLNVVLDLVPKRRIEIDMPGSDDTVVIQPTMKGGTFKDLAPVTITFKDWEIAGIYHTHEGAAFIENVEDSI